MSAGPPAANGTIIRTPLLGYDCAHPLCHCMQNVAANANSFNVTAGAGCIGSGAPGEPAIVNLFAGCLASKNAVLSDAMNGGGLLGFGFAKDVAKPAAELVELSLTAPANHISVEPMLASMT